MNPSKILVRNLIDFGLISLLELRGTLSSNVLLVLLLQLLCKMRVATTATTTLFYFVDLS